MKKTLQAWNSDDAVLEFRHETSGDGSEVVVVDFFDSTDPRGVVESFVLSENDCRELAEYLTCTR